MEYNNKKVCEYTVAILGGGGCGKSSYITRLLNDDFEEKDWSDPTLLDEYFGEFEMDGREYAITLMDTAGQEQYFEQRREIIRTVNGYLLIYDITQHLSFEEVEAFVNEICRIQGKDSDEIPIVILGNKLDLEDKRKITADQRKALSFDAHSPVIEVSARSGNSVRDSLDTLLKELDYYTKRGRRGWVELQKSKKRWQRRFCRLDRESAQLQLGKQAERKADTFIDLKSIMGVGKGEEVGQFCVYVSGGESFVFRCVDPDTGEPLPPAQGLIAQKAWINEIKFFASKAQSGCEIGAGLDLGQSKLANEVATASASEVKTSPASSAELLSQKKRNKSKKKSWRSFTKNSNSAVVSAEEEEEEDEGGAASDLVVVKVKAVVNYSSSRKPDRLEMNKGDVISVTARDEEGKYYRGELNKKTGWFPSKYCVPWDTKAAETIVKRLHVSERQPFSMSSGLTLDAKVKERQGRSRTREGGRSGRTSHSKGSGGKRRSKSKDRWRGSYIERPKHGGDSITRGRTKKDSKKKSHSHRAQTAIVTPASSHSGNNNGQNDPEEGAHHHHHGHKKAGRGTKHGSGNKSNKGERKTKHTRDPKRRSADTVAPSDNDPKISLPFSGGKGSIETDDAKDTTHNDKKSERKQQETRKEVWPPYNKAKARKTTEPICTADTQQVSVAPGPPTAKEARKRVSQTTTTPVPSSRLKPARPKTKGRPTPTT